MHIIEAKNLNNHLKYPPLFIDYAFKSIFMVHKDILTILINDLTGYKLNNLILEMTNIPNKTANEKFKQCDFIIKDSNYLINIELNNNYYKSLINKNSCYIFDIYATKTERGKKYNDDLTIIQININNFTRFGKSLALYQIQDNKDIYLNNLKIYDLDIVNCQKVYYNECNECMRVTYWGCLFGSKSLKDINLFAVKLFGEPLAKEFMKTVYQVIGSNDYLERSNEYMSSERFIEMLKHEFRNEGREEGIKEGIEQGIEKGIEQGIEKGIEQGIEQGIEKGIEQGIEQGIEMNCFKTIKNMLNMNLSIDIISKVTGKSIEEINKYLVTE